MLSRDLARRTTRKPTKFWSSLRRSQASLGMGLRPTTSHQAALSAGDLRRHDGQLPTEPESYLIAKLDVDSAVGSVPS